MFKKKSPSFVRLDFEHPDKKTRKSEFGQRSRLPIRSYIGSFNNI